MQDTPTIKNDNVCHSKKRKPTRYQKLRNVTNFVFTKATEKKWYIIDATDVVLGRLATRIATILKGKDNPNYTPNSDNGGNIVVINSKKVRVTGDKAEKKIYYHHTGYPGGIKARTFKNVIEGKNPSDAIMLAVKRMLGKGPMAYKRLSNLHLYVDTKHKHEAQKPELIEIN